MNRKFTVLIADRNPHIREFMRRELTRDGLTVITAHDLKEILHYTFGPSPADLLVIDPDIPGINTSELIGRLNDRIPPLPFVLHSLPGYRGGSDISKLRPQIIEKGSSSIDLLKNVIRELETNNHTNTTGRKT